MGEYQTLINVSAGFVLTAMGWFAKTLWDAVQELKSDIAKLREELPKTYFTKSDFMDFREEFRQKMDRLMDKMDTKVDK